MTSTLELMSRSWLRRIWIGEVRDEGPGIKVILGGKQTEKQENLLITICSGAFVEGDELRQMRFFTMISKVQCPSRCV